MQSRIALLILALITMLSVVTAQEDNSWMAWKNDIGNTRWLMYHLEKSDVEILKEKWNAVGQSLEKNQTEYSGSYIIPAYMSGYFFRWSKEAGYVFVRFFDVEHPCYFSFGDVELTGSVIRFIHKGESSSSACPPSSSGRPAEEWIPALGGQYLVPRSELKEFIDYYSGFNDFNGHLRKPDDKIPFPIFWGKTDENQPKFILPDDFSSFIKSPLNGEIISVGKTRTRRSKIFVFGSDKAETITSVTIDLGRKHGLKTKQEFILLTDDDGTSETLIVTSVGQSHSKGVVVRTINDKGKEGFLEWDNESDAFVPKPFTKLRPGIKITTSPLSKI